MWSGIWSQGKSRIGFWTWIWSTRLCEMRAGSGSLTSILEQLDLFRMTSLITLLLLTWKRIGLLLRKSHLLRCWGWLSLQNWIGSLALPLLLKLPPRKLNSWFLLWILLLLRLLCISINLPYCHAWNNVVMSGLVLLVANWNCWIYDKDGYSRLLVLHLCLSWILGSSLKCTDVHLVQLVPLSRGRSTRHSDRLYDFSVTISR